jgi:Domain of unknown function (DUF2760)
MTNPKLSIVARLALAWRTLIDGRFAAEVAQLTKGELSPSPGPTSVQTKAAHAPLKETSPESALQMLGLLQQEGRFLDFIEEDIAAFSDADIGAAARLVHEGCHKALCQYLTIEPVRGEGEGSRITLESGFDASAIRLTGNVVGQPPFTGTLAHRGWRATEAKLPKLAESHDVKVLAPAEVEL